VVDDVLKVVLAQRAIQRSPEHEKAISY